MNLKKLLLVLVVLAGAQEAFARGGRGGGGRGFGGRGGGGRGWHRGGGWGWGLGGAGLGLATGYALGSANNYPYYTQPSTTYVIDKSASQSDVDVLRAENRALSQQIEDLRRSMNMPTEQVHPAVQDLKQQNAWLKQQIELLQKN